MHTQYSATCAKHACGPRGPHLALQAALDDGEEPAVQGVALVVGEGQVQGPWHQVAGRHELVQGGVAGAQQQRHGVDGPQSMGADRGLQAGEGLS